MTQLVKIGNSRGVRIPSTLIQQARLDAGELVMKAVEGGLLIQVREQPRQPRAGWAEALDKALSGKAHRLSKEDREWLDADLSEVE